MVFSFRHRTPKDRLLSFEGNSVIIYAIKNGMIGKGSVANNELGEITISDSSAKSLIVSRGAETVLFFMFYKEQNEWKLDLISFFPTANIIFEQLVKNDGRTENEYLFYLLETLTKREVTNAIWQPIVD